MIKLEDEKTGHAISKYEIEGSKVKIEILGPGYSKLTMEIRDLLLMKYGGIKTGSPLLSEEEKKID